MKQSVLPVVSVIICTYKREYYILEALYSLVNQSLENNQYEIIIVNNNSPDNTESICSNFIEQHSEFNIHYFLEENPGLSNARNLGLSKSKGNFIVYIDDDGVADTNFLQNIINNFNSYPEFGAQGGKVIPIYEDGKPIWMSKPLEGLVSKVDYGNHFHEFNNKKYPVGCNMAFRKEVFEQTGLFNTSLTIRSDDKYMFYRIREHGIKILYAPNVVVHHHIDSYRLTENFIQNQSIQIGEGEKLRLTHRPLKEKVQKHLEYWFKISASLLLALQWLLRMQPTKAKFIVMVLWLTYLGYIGIKKPA